VRLDTSFEVDHHHAGFEMKRPPRSVSVQASLTLTRERRRAASRTPRGTWFI
jgi:hypothetical protein